MEVRIMKQYIDDEPHYFLFGIGYAKGKELKKLGYKWIPSKPSGMGIWELPSKDALKQYENTNIPLVDVNGKLIKIL